MSRKTLLNIFSLVFQPSLQEEIRKDLMGAEVKVTELVAETTLTLDFSEFRFHDVTLGSANISALNATVTGLLPGEIVFLKITQDSSAARTVTFGTGIITGVTVSDTTDDVDLLVGVFDGTNINFTAFNQAESLETEVNTTVLTDETTLTLDFGEHTFQDVTLGSANLSALNATVTGLKTGQTVYLKITQDSTAARTVAFNTGILTDVTISNTTDDIDLLVGVFDGTNIIFGALAKNVS